MTEVEGVINTRPLTYVSGIDDVDDQVLTPAHFLTPGRKIGIPVCSTDDLDDDFIPANAPRSSDVVQQWQRQQLQLENFWKHWQQEYLPMLLDRPNSHRKSHPSVSVTPQPGEVVVIHGQNARGSWQLGRILTVTTSSLDGATRTAKLKTSSGVLTRPINLLYPLEAARQPTPTPRLRILNLRYLQMTQLMILLTVL